MTVSIEATTVDVELAMERFARKMGVALKDVYVDQMRLANNQLIKLFHPKTAGQGKRRIKRETSNLFVKIGTKDLNMVKQWQAIGEQPAGTMFKTSRGAVFGVEQPYWNIRGDQEMMRQHHKRHRSRATGRSSMAGSWTRDIGRWKFINRQVVPRRAYDKYLRTVNKRVGMLKAGWIAKNAPYRIKAPKWIWNALEFAQARGEYTDQMDFFATGFLKLQNNMPHAPARDGLVKIAMRTRVRDLQRHASKRVDQLAARWNKGRV